MARGVISRRVGGMVDKVTATEFDATADLPDWRVLLGRIEATFRTGSFEAGAAFVGLIASAAEAADHHPDVDLRYPDRVSVTLVTHAARRAHRFRRLAGEDDLRAGGRRPAFAASRR